MIHELLRTGAENAITGKELAAILNCNIRDITTKIEAERREGQPICASAAGVNGGYYLAANDEELQEYCNRIQHRAAELFKTRRALLNVLKQAADKKAQEQEQEHEQNTIDPMQE